jgi:hypothetical protein
MRSTIAIALTMLVPTVGGCAHAEIDRDAERQLDEASNRATARLVTGSCRGSAIGPGCGLITRHAQSEDFREKFRARVCATKSTEQCEAALQRLIDAELQRRYFAADWRAVASTCDLSPPKCDDPVAYEKLLLASHNTNVQAKYDEESAQIEAERQAKQRAAVENDWATAALALDVAASITRPRPQCESYPSAFDGTVTVCAP